MSKSSLYDVGQRALLKNPRKKLNAGRIPGNKDYAAGTVPANKKYAANTPNKFKF